MTTTRFPPRSVLVAPDKFKGTLTAAEAGVAIEAGLKRAWPAATFCRIALADGGEGFAEALVAAAGGCLHRFQTVDAAGRPCEAAWGDPGDGATAVVDLASSSGLAQLPAELRSPMRTSTFGTGLLLKHIIDSGRSTIVVGLGGSATNDGAMGIAAAFGFRFLDRDGHVLAPGGAELGRIARIETPAPLPAVRFIVATDVENPLCGPQGAAFQFAGQKGASAAEIAELDEGLRNFAEAVARTTGRDLSMLPGAGAAGGCGFGMMALLGAERVSGFEFLSARIGLERLIAGRDLVVTGEGCLDATSLSGKGPMRLARLARELGVPVWGVFGRIALANPGAYFDRSSALPECAAGALASLSSRDHAGRVEAAAERLARAD